MPPSVLYFDLGKVLLSFSHERMCAQMSAAAGVPADLMWSAIFGGDDALAAQWQYESGKITTDEYFAYLCRAIGRSTDLQRLAEACCDIFAPIVETCALVERLAGAGNRLAILSNTNPLQWEYIADGRFPLFAHIGTPKSPFSWAMLSYEVGALKPERAIYKAAITRAGVAAHEIFFVDDRSENVAAARSAGIDAVQFLAAEQLIAELQARCVPGAC